MVSMFQITSAFETIEMIAFAVRRTMFADPNVAGFCLLCASEQYTFCRRDTVYIIR